MRQSGEVSTTLSAPIKVRASDQFGNGVAGVVITWSVTSGGGSLLPTTNTTDTSGAATFWTLGATLGAQGAQGAAAGLDRLAGGLHRDRRTGAAAHDGRSGGEQFVHTCERDASTLASESAGPGRPGRSRIAWSPLVTVRPVSSSSRAVPS